jgi:uncharacterized protein with von Willebrand factor type A (vWA) domain
MLRSIDTTQKLPGETILLVDISGSMDWKLSDKSEMKRMDAASGLAVLLREICESVRVFTFSNSLVEVKAFRGLALVDAIKRSQPYGGTYLGKALGELPKMIGAGTGRIIVVTDEQAHDDVGKPSREKGYIVNVASAKNGIGYRRWIHVDGWSEAIVDYIREFEAS